MNVEFNIIVDGLLNNIDTIEKANFYYNLFRDYKEQVTFYEEDYKELKKHVYILNMCEELNMSIYQSTYLRRMMGIHKPRFMSEPNPIIFMFYKNVASQYLKWLDDKIDNIMHWYNIE